MIQVGQTIGNYTITAKLGEGGMGVVYLAEHPVIGRKVALKAIHPELARNPEVVSRFMTEAKSVNQIGNEHIVDVSDFGNTPDGEFYFIMEFLQGEALADRLHRERLFEVNRGLQVAAQVADALAASHDHGIIHRDLKPENIFLINRGQSPDFVKVLDFGLAKLTQGEEKVTHKTRTGSVMGTPYYMAPEQCEGKPNIDHRADIYSLGVIIFEMLTGRVPFGGEGYGEIIVKHITMPPPSPRSLNPALTPAHEAVLLRALEKKREERFQTMTDLRAALLDPEGYAAGAPRPAGALGAAVTGSTPTPRVDEDVSGAVVFGALPRAKASDGDRTSQPSTFRDGAGELVEERATKSKTGIIVGAVAAAAIAGVAAFFALGKQSAPPKPDPVAAAPAPSPAPSAVPAPPERVKISFGSSPLGAKVTRKDTGEELGTTPFDRTLPFAKEPVAFVFKKDGYLDQEMGLAPTSDSQLSPTLLALRVAVSPEPSVGKSSRSSSRGSRKATASASGPAKPMAKKPGGKTPVDEDGVLEPTFK